MMKSYSAYQSIYVQIIKACPSAREIFSLQNQSLPPSRLASSFANHLLELYRAGHVEEFASLAIQIEKFYSLQDKAVRDWATLGLLESIMIVWEKTEIDPTHFKRYLRGKSMIDWDRLSSFWTDAEKSS